MTTITNRFTILQEHLFSIFASSAWIAEQLDIIPKGYIGKKPTDEYIEFNPIVAGTGVKDSMNGILYIKIYTRLESGPRRASEIADILDKYLSGKSFKNEEFCVTQFQRSTNFVIRGESHDSKAFILSDYQIQFGFFRKES